MTTPAHQSEADHAGRAYQIALTAIGVATVDEALKLWASTPPTMTAATAAAWLRRAVTLIMTRRGLARSLAMAYYRLARALRTGRTVADPRRPSPPYVTLSTLRREFALLAPAYTLPSTQRTDPVDEPVDEPVADRRDDEPTPTGELASEAPGASDEQIPVDVLDEAEADDERQERAAEIIARYTLVARGSHRLETVLEALDLDGPADSIDKARVEAHSDAGAKQAAAAERLVLNGARTTTWNTAKRDRLVLGWIRRSRTGTPCDWCSMLLSRGAVYKSASSADAKTAKAFTVRKGVDRLGRTGMEVRGADYAEGDQFHDDCHCVAEQIFTRTQYDSPAYDLNRRYAALWPDVTRGYFGKAAVARWRRYIRESRAQEA